ncbi:protein of unknown function [Cupriavidus taiwanensis]|uniref:Uncharacterized protein n=1 Tax=Cupriavidus taiwanensis TaxID=164546 RepID=A0A375IEA4_9BURK|nr:protein of unknown function [Cupriavidus taiwanensis]
MACCWGAATFLPARLAPNHGIIPIKKMRKTVYIFDSEAKSAEFVTNFDM